MAEQCDVCSKISDRKNHWRHINTHKKQLVDMMSVAVLNVVRKWRKPIVWIREGDRTKYAYCMDCLSGTTCTSSRMSDVDVWMKRHIAVCKADWSKYEAYYEPKPADPKSTELFSLEQLQQTILELRTENAQLKQQLDEIMILKIQEQTKIAEKRDLEKHRYKKCWLCEGMVEHRFYEDHIIEHKKKLNCGLWSHNKDEFLRMMREGPIAHSPDGKAGFCIRCKSIFPISECAKHMRDCIIDGQSATKWWKTAQDDPAYRPASLAIKQGTNPIVGSPEPAQEPPTSPTLSVQNDSSDTESRNEIHYVSSNSETTGADEDDAWETRSVVSCSPMEYWDMDVPGVQRIFGVLSDILEQKMKYKEARAEYRELLEELEPDKDSIGKPWKVLEAYITDEYTPKDLGNFLALQD